MFDVVGVILAIINTIISAIRLAIDVFRNKKQDSNPPTKV